MKPEQDQQLVKEFPLLYADRFGSMQETCMCWGFSCGSGWYKLIYDLSAKLEPLIAAMPEACQCSTNGVNHPRHEGECPLCIDKTWEWKGEISPANCPKFYDLRPKASQVKEKYGTLRFYMTTSTDEMDKLIDEAEAASATICEDCGAPGETRGGGWIRTLCDVCLAEERKINAKYLKEMREKREKM